MNEIRKVTEWVEYKIGKFLTDDIEKRIDSDISSFNIEKYSWELYEKHFLGEIEKNISELKIFNSNLRLNLGMEDFSDDSNDDDLCDYQIASLDSIIQDLQDSSEMVQIQALQSLQICPGEGLITQNSWSLARKILQDMIKKNKLKSLLPYILELFRRFLLSYDTPKVVCEGFVNLTQGIIFHIGAINLMIRKSHMNYTYDPKLNKWMHNLNSVQVNEAVKIDISDIKFIFKSMWLLVQSQKGITVKWSRFNEKRLKEIVFSFIHMLSLTENLKENDGLCGLEILSILDPRAVWVSNWSHGATGRTLLCSALKAHKKLFDEVINFILISIKSKDTGQLARKFSTIGIKLPPLGANVRKVQIENENRNACNRNKNVTFGHKFSARLSVKKSDTSTGNRSAPTLKFEEIFDGKIADCMKKHHSDWNINGIPKEVVDDAKFCHCMTMVVYLIQYRSGRLLFPSEVALRRRITVADFIGLLVNYINGLLFFKERNPMTKEAYRKHMLKLLQILKSI